MIVGTDQHAFVGDAFDCEGLLGHSGGPVCGQGPTAYIHRPPPAPLSPKWAAMTPELPTSAQLRQTQQALAASQADLTRVERERDRAQEERAYTRRAAQRLMEERDLARAELATATAELEQLRARLNPNPAEDS